MNLFSLRNIISNSKNTIHQNFEMHFTAFRKIFTISVRQLKSHKVLCGYDDRRNRIALLGYQNDLKYFSLRWLIEIDFLVKWLPRRKLR